ncbi:hypothetical protein D3C72_1207280 [compost metagenome]
MAETAEVASILGAAMGEEEEPATSQPDLTPAIAVVSDARFDGLDAKYQRVLAQLLQKGVWAKSEFDELVRQHSLMPSGVIEALNEWSDERHGDFLIEEGDPLTVQAHLLKEAA